VLLNKEADKTLLHSPLDMFPFFIMYFVCNSITQQNFNTVLEGRGVILFSSE